MRAQLWVSSRVDVSESPGPGTGARPSTYAQLSRGTTGISGGGREAHPAANHTPANNIAARPMAHTWLFAAGCLDTPNTLPSLTRISHTHRVSRDWIDARTHSSLRIKWRERRDGRGARLTRRVREEYLVYFDRNATMSGTKWSVQTGCIARRTPRDFVHRLIGAARVSPSSGGRCRSEAPTGRTGRRSRCRAPSRKVGVDAIPNLLDRQQVTEKSLVSWSVSMRNPG